MQQMPSYSGQNIAILLKFAVNFNFNAIGLPGGDVLNRKGVWKGT